MNVRDFLPWSLHGYGSALLLPALLLAVACFYLLLRPHRLPPGPPALPFVGHLHLLLNSIPHHTLYKLSQRYGPIVFLRLGSVPSVFVSSPALAKHVLHHHDPDFADRPPLEVAQRMLYNNSASGLMDANARWRDIRKVYTQGILSARSVQLYKHIRDEEITLLIQDARKQAGSVVSVREMAFLLSLNILSRLLFSRRADGRFSILPHLIRDGARILASPILGDVFPYLKWFDPAGYRNKMDAMFKEWDAVLDGIVRERLQQLAAQDEVPKDMLATLLEFNEKINASDTTPVKAMIIDLLAGGTETSSSTIEWAMVELLLNPATMQELQEEMDRVIGSKNRPVEESDFKDLPYLEAVIKETWRLHPPLPMLLPHYAKKATQIGDYSLPKNTRVMVNVWAIGRDERSWEKPHEFRPERFMGDGEDKGLGVTGRDFQLLPFGSGRRGCPGIHLGIPIVFLCVANLVHNFTWKSPTPISLEETMGTSSSLLHPLLAIPTSRHALAQQAHIIFTTQ